MILPSQCRAARALLGWSQDDLAKKADVSKQTLADFERGARNPYKRTLLAIYSALQTAGIAFIPGNGRGVGVQFSPRQHVG